MSKIDVVRKEMMEALKAKDTPRKDALSLLLAALKSKQIDKRSELTEDEENAVVMKEIKSAQEAIDTAPPSRQDIIDENKFKIAVYSEFAPRLMSEDDVKAVIAVVLGQLGIEKPAPTDKGNIMKVLMPLVKGKADGKMINKLVEEALK